MRKCVPLLNLDTELTAAGLRKTVVFCAPPVFRFAPERAQPSGFFHLVQGGKEGARAHLKSVSSDLLNTPGDAESVHFGFSDGFQNEEVECALKDVGRHGGQGGSYRVPI